MNDYDKQAKDFIGVSRLTVKITLAKKQACPPWREATTFCDHVHGHKYNITVKHAPMGRVLRFPYWGSRADADNGVSPSAYDVLTCLSSDSTLPEDVDGYLAEFGYDKTPIKQIERTVKFGEKVRQFFTDIGALDALREVQ
jgi:hypothetical protein